MMFRVIIDYRLLVECYLRKFKNSEMCDILDIFINSEDVECFIPSFAIEKIYKLLKDKNSLKQLLRNFQTSKTPSYIDIEGYDNIENALLAASAKAVEAYLITENPELLNKIKNIALAPHESIKKLEFYRKTRNIPLLDLKHQIYKLYPDIEIAIDKVIAKANFILGDEVKVLEDAIANYIGTKYAVGVSSGTDALVLSLRALAIQRKNQEYWDKDDLIITTPFTFTATGDAILRAGATPLFVDIDLDTYNINPEFIEKAVKKYGKRVKGILPVHLYGQPCNMDEIMRIANEYDLFVVEDCAQSFGAKWDGKQTGSFGDTGCFSFFPSKNLGGFGDGGMITTDDEQLYEIITMLRKHGGKDKYNVDHIGYNARLDTLQAAILLAKMKYIDSFIKKRREIAKIYNEKLKNIKWIEMPKTLERAFHVYNQYTIRIKDKDRKELQKKLKEKGIHTMIYYPVPLHKMKVFKNARMEVFGSLKNSELASEKVLSLPIEPTYNIEIFNHVIQHIQW